MTLFKLTMATSMRSGFLGTSLKDSRKVETPRAARSQNMQVQALFKGLQKAAGKGEKEASKAAGKASKFGKKVQQKAPAKPKLGAKKGTQTVKKAAKKATKGGTRSTGGWLGGAGGAQGLEKWYGESSEALLAHISAPSRLYPVCGYLGVPPLSQLCCFSCKLL